MRKFLVAVLAVALVATGSLMGSLKPSSKQTVAERVVSRGTVAVDYDPKAIDGTILMHQLVEKADRGAFIASGIELMEYNTFVKPANRRFREQVASTRCVYNMRC